MKIKTITTNVSQDKKQYSEKIKKYICEVKYK